MNAIVCTDRAGPCVVITKRFGSILGISPTDDVASWVIPFFDETKFSATQKLKQPVKEFFDDLKDFIINSDAVSASGLSNIADAIFKGLDLFGIQLFSKGFFAQAWHGEEPTPFSLTLKFFMGMLGVWDASVEVFTPIINIIKQTVPQEPKPWSLITPPLPSPAATFVAFSGQIIGGVASAVGAGVQAILGTNPVTSAAGTVVDSALNWFTDKIVNSTAGGTWRVEFGWKDKGSTTPKIYFSIPFVIVESSTWSFSPMLQQKGTKYYPINGEITLNFKTQTFLTNLDLQDSQGTT